MQVIITITTDNEAFSDDPAGEVRRILAKLIRSTMLADVVVGDHVKLYDLNGNTVGRYEVKGG